MARKVNDSCMFCFGVGCEVCVKPSKKVTKKAPVVKPTPVATTPEPSASQPDVKAAMKSVAVQVVKQTEDDRNEFLEAIVALEPILHPDEIANLQPSLDQYKSRSERWRQRREQLNQ